MGVLRSIRLAPNPDVVRTLRRLCHEAEMGEITSAGFVLVRRAGAVSTGWDVRDGDTHKLCSGAASLAYRITKAADEQST